MGKQVMRLAILLAIVGVVLVGLTAVAHAQGTDPRCRNPGRMDLTGDNMVTRDDIVAWKTLYLRSFGEGCNITTGDVSQCPLALDLDGDGRVEVEDAAKQLDLWLLCSRTAFVVPR